MSTGAARVCILVRSGVAHQAASLPGVDFEGDEEMLASMLASAESVFVFGVNSRCVSG